MRAGRAKLSLNNETIELISILLELVLIIHYLIYQLSLLFVLWRTFLSEQNRRYSVSNGFNFFMNILGCRNSWDKVTKISRTDFLKMMGAIALGTFLKAFLIHTNKWLCNHCLLALQHQYSWCIRPAWPMRQKISLQLQLISPIVMRAFWEYWF